MGPEFIRSVFPYFLHGTVVKGFGRGGKQLGCPTANLTHEVVEELPKEVSCGVYYGWASVDDGPVHGMVMSIGWNPHFHNTKKTVEAHLMHDFVKDFYGAHLKLIILGFLREMESYSSLDELKAAIARDIRTGEEKLNQTESLLFKNHEFFQLSGEKKTEFFNNLRRPVKSSV